MRPSGTIEDTAFLQTLKLKTGARCMLIHNINTNDGLTNGQQGTLIHVVSNEKRVQYILIKFDDPKIGEQQKRKYRHLSKILKHPELVPIERYNFSYTLGDVSKKHGARASLLQFPIRLSWALTAHKCQGQSILRPNSVHTDLNECFAPAQSYVLLSRIT